MSYRALFQIFPLFSLFSMRQDNFYHCLTAFSYFLYVYTARQFRKLSYRVSFSCTPLSTRQDNPLDCLTVSFSHCLNFSARQSLRLSYRDLKPYKTIPSIVLSLFHFIFSLFFLLPLTHTHPSFVFQVFRSKLAVFDLVFQVLRL